MHDLEKILLELRPDLHPYTRLRPVAAPPGKIAQVTVGNNIRKSTAMEIRRKTRSPVPSANVNQTQTVEKNESWNPDSGDKTSFGKQ
jgi:hypothetical protein